MAVDSRRGSGAGSVRHAGVGGRQLLDHPHFHAAFRRLPQGNVVHEAAHEEDAAPARLEEILGGQRIGDFLDLEPLALIADEHDQFDRRLCRLERELDGDELVLVEPVAVLDRVDDRLAHGHADPVDGVLVEARHLTQMIAHHLNQVQHVEHAVDPEPDEAATVGH